MSFREWIDLGIALVLLVVSIMYLKGNVEDIKDRKFEGSKLHTFICIVFIVALTGDCLYLSMTTLARIIMGVAIGANLLSLMLNVIMLKRNQDDKKKEDDCQ